MATISRALGGVDTGYPQLGTAGLEGVKQARNIVLLVIDGLGYHYLTGPGRGSLLESHCIDRLTSVCPSTTATAIPTFLTGLPPQQHGFTGWFTYFSELGSVLTVLPFHNRLGQVSIDESMLSPADLSGVGSFFQGMQVSGHAFMPDWIAGSVFNRAFSGEARIHPFSGLHGLSSGLLQLLARIEGRNYISAYWPGFDALAHEHGVASGQVQEHFNQIDDLFSELVSGMEGTDTALLVTADHGFIDISPETAIQLADHPALAETLVVPLCGEPRLAYCYVHPDRQQRFEEYVRENLASQADLFPSRQLLDEGWFGKGTPHPRLRDRIGHYALVMKENFIIKGQIPGERPHRHIGVHGGVSPEEMYVPLICSMG